jgi:4-alpha-glucanotransferase
VQKSRKFQLVLLIHAHQPVGNFDDVIERAYTHCYLPFVELLEKHPQIRFGLHLSGCLLEWIENAHPEYFDLLRRLEERNQLEMVGGGYYEPILISIPQEDRREQIDRLSDYLEKHFHRRPRGAWLTERVWEPQLPSTLCAAGIEYSLVDDNNFLGAGFEHSQLRGPYIAEELGNCVRIIPGLKILRYLIPYREPEETIKFLRQTAAEHPGGFAAMGDDCEKFGAWPNSYQYCYKDGWLERFCVALEANSDWLETSAPGDAVRSRAPLGRAELPAASYNEMMQWALPTEARLRFEAIEKEFASRDDVQVFLRGGIWRSFMAKYPEANLLHAKMLHVSAKIRRLALGRRRGSSFRSARADAETLLLRSQCNDAYWHGVFGGLYSPHLRTALWRSLVEAESIADRLTRRETSWSEVKRFDFDSDGCEEIYFTSESYAVLVDPADGATIPAIDFRPSNVALINSIARRVEVYHARLTDNSARGTQAAASIHDQPQVKESGLEHLLRYDRCGRNCFRVLLFSSGKRFADYEHLRLDEDAGIAGGSYTFAQVDDTGATLHFENEHGWRATKSFKLASSGDGFEIACGLELSSESAAKVQVGIETVLNFLAPDDPDRYIEAHNEKRPLRWSAAIPASELRIVDEYQDIAASVAAPGAHEYWIAPIDTVSDSESGFERVYQGSQILAVWPVELTPGTPWRGKLTLRFAKLR